MQSNSRNIYKIGRRTTGFTQEHWAEALGVSVESVRGYETGKQVPSDEVVRAMSEISGLAQLSYWHLCRKSELAADLLPELEAVPLPQAVIQLICSIRDFANRHRSDALMNIAADGVIDESERPEFNAIVRELEGIVQAALQLKYSEGGAGSAHNKASVIVSKRAIFDPDLSLKAKGLFAIMSGVADGQPEFSIGVVDSLCKEGTSAFRAAVHELTDRGYIEHYRKRNNGQLAQAVYTICPDPTSKDGGEHG